MIKLSSRGDFKKTYAFFNRSKEALKLRALEKYAQKGVDALSASTPVDTGKTAASWYYEISRKEDTITITWKNSNIVDGVCVAVVLQYGHATPGGGYIRGIDYINPAIRPVFEEISKYAWEEVRD